MGIHAQWLAEQVAQRRVMPFKFAEQMMLVDGRSAVYWIAQDLLIVSDLHLEKGSYLGQFANPIPHYDSLKTLQMLADIIADYQPKTIVSLGDSFHDTAAFARMQEQEKALLSRIVNDQAHWVWILGNHDPKLPDEVGGEQKVAWEIGGVLLVHEPEPVARAQIIGHFHPKTTIQHNRLKVRGRSLLTSKDKMIMPAFGQYTGGLDSADPVLDEVFCSPKRAGFVLSEQRVFPF